MAGAGDEAEKELGKAKVAREAEDVLLPRELSITHGEIVFGQVPNLQLPPQQPNGTNLPPRRTRSGRPTQKEKGTAKATRVRGSPTSVGTKLDPPI